MLTVVGEQAHAEHPGRSIVPGATALAVVFFVMCAPFAGAGEASAQSLLPPRVSFDGFGAVGVAYSSQTDADFVENPTRIEGTGHTRELDHALDSRFAGQVTVEAGSRLTGVVQVVVEMDTDGEYRPQLEWANVRFSLTPDLSVRGGRIVLPLFLVSETRKVSFANPWLRPPVELYSLIPIYSWDGVDATYHRRLGDWTGVLNGALGRAESDIPGGHARADRFWTVNAAVVRGGFIGRGAVASGQVTVDAYAPLFEGFHQFGPAGEALAERYAVDGTPLRFASLGTEYDHGSWFVLAEAAWTGSNSAMGDRAAGYLTGGVRAGALTPYLTLSRVALLSESSASGLPIDGMPAQAAQAAAELNAGLNFLLRSNPDQRTIALGARWDVRSGVAMKAQVDFMDLLDDSFGTFRNHQSQFEPGGSVQLASVSATFVF